ncbi:MAG: hypothetical protein ACF8SC_07145 [Phycisphaerales bacterium JB037]
MSAGRPNPPLFEILTRNNGSASSPPRPRTGPLPRIETPERSSPASPVARLNIPVYAVYLAVSLALALCAAVWAVAYRVGRDAGERETLQQLGTVTAPPPRSPDPLLATSNPAMDPEGPPTNPVPRTTPPRDSTPRSTDQPARPSLTINPAFTPGPVLNHRGEIVADPRTRGTNYLHLASDLPRDEAERLLSYLAAYGVEAIAVPSDPARVDSLAADANNDLPMSVYSLRGVASDEFENAAGQRERHRTLVARLGEVWLRDHRGSVNLAKTNWELYPPRR